MRAWSLSGFFLCLGLRDLVATSIIMKCTLIFPVVLELALLVRLWVVVPLAVVMVVMMVVIIIIVSMLWHMLNVVIMVLMLVFRYVSAILF